MCQLFGLSARQAVLVNDSLREFFSHSEVHQHGWGFASFGADITHIEKEPQKAAESTYLRQILTWPLQATTVFAHIRYATVGVPSEVNCHPFSSPDISHRRWTLIHNGTIARGELLDPYRSEQLGQTDSERVLYCLLDRIKLRTLAQGRALNEAERASELERLLAELSEGNTINLLLYDGDVLYVYANDRFEERDTGQLAAIWRRANQDGYLFSTVPLDDEPWELVPLEKLIRYREGVELSA